MSYETGQALILERIRELLAFDELNTSEGDWVILNTGKAVYAILHPGPFENQQHGGAGSYVCQWTTFIDLWVIIKKYADAQDTLVKRRDELIDKFRKYRKLGDSTDSILDASITSGNEVLEITLQENKVAFLKQTLILQWMEVTSVTLAE